MTDRARLEEMKVDELQAEAERRGLPKSGNKAELVDRLVSGQSGAQQAASGQADVSGPPQSSAAEAQKTTPRAEPTLASTGALQPAGESTDPEVHRLLAERETARLNNSQDGVDDIDRRLRDLGYSTG